MIVKLRYLLTKVYLQRACPYPGLNCEAEAMSPAVLSPAMVARLALVGSWPCRAADSPDTITWPELRAEASEDTGVGAAWLTATAAAASPPPPELS